VFSEPGYRIPATHSENSMKFRVADRNSNADALAKLFSGNLTAEYISHSELQGPRAPAPGKWTPNIDAVLRREIAERLGPPQPEFPRSNNWLGVVEAFDDDALVGLAFVTIAADAPIPYGVIEDIVIDTPRRGTGLGEEFMRWLIDSFARAGIRRTFLESGIGNEHAHHLFERLGFETTSIVMMRDG
jgi:ribosomal protein S18 acetylase RimI-like enzyme